MRLGDVVQCVEDETQRYRCRGCDRWVLLKDASEVGECGSGCCTDYQCPRCEHVTRVEWPD